MPESTARSNPVNPQLQAFRQGWRRLSPLPLGKWLFSRLVGWMVPYSGSIKPYVEILSPGYGRISIRDRRRVRNHLRSVHAVALMNLGELTTGLTMAFGLPDDARAIVTRLAIEFPKKARGPITAECRCEVPESNATRDLTTESILTDATGDVVARVSAVWRVGPNQ
ncbi:MAG TPA: DUF4442 domain-containing protein [Thermoanaerobaculia bacterium]|nr:DUF4442 domain-containing protein [Thermoanaerobaculia bacterium]